MDRIKKVALCFLVFVPVLVGITAGEKSADDNKSGFWGNAPTVYRAYGDEKVLYRSRIGDFLSKLFR